MCYLLSLRFVFGVVYFGVGRVLLGFCVVVGGVFWEGVKGSVGWSGLLKVMWLDYSS